MDYAAMRTSLHFKEFCALAGALRRVQLAVLGEADRRAFFLSPSGGGGGGGRVLWPQGGSADPRVYAQTRTMR